MGNIPLRRDRLVWRLGEALSYGALSYPEQPAQGARWFGRARAICQLLELPPPPPLPDGLSVEDQFRWIFARMGAEDPIMAAVLAGRDRQVVACYDCSLRVLPFGLAPREARGRMGALLQEAGEGMGLDPGPWAERLDAIDPRSVHELHDAIDRELVGGPLRGPACARGRLAAWRIGTALALAGALRVMNGAGEEPLAEAKQAEAAALADALGVELPPPFRSPGQGTVPDLFALRAWLLEGPGLDLCARLEALHGIDVAALLGVAGRVVLLRQVVGPEAGPMVQDWLASTLDTLGCARLHPTAWRRLLRLQDELPAREGQALIDATLAAIGAALEREARGEEQATNSDPPRRRVRETGARRLVYELGFDLAQAAMLAGIGEPAAAAAVFDQVEGTLRLLELPAPPSLPQVSLLEEPAAAAEYVLRLRESELGLALHGYGVGLSFLLVSAGQLGLLSSPLADTWPAEIQASTRASILRAGGQGPEAEDWTRVVAAAEARDAGAVRAHGQTLREPQPGPLERLHAAALGLNLVADAALRLDGKHELAGTVRSEIELNGAALDVPVPPTFQPTGNPQVDPLTFTLYCSLGAVAQAARSVERTWGQPLAALVQLGAVAKLFQLILPEPGGEDWIDGATTHADAIALHATRAGLPPALWAEAALLPAAQVTREEAKARLGALLEGILAHFRGQAPARG